MRRILATLVMGAFLAPAAMVVGCDETLEHERSVDVKSDGSSVTKERTVTEHPDGSISKTEEKKVNQ